MASPPPPVVSKPVIKGGRVIQKRAAKAVVPRIIVAAVEGWGKSTFGAYATNPMILMARGETGYLTLLAAGRVPSVPAEVVDTWEEAHGWLDHLIANPGEIDTLVLDAAGGFERLCNDMVTARDFNGKPGDPGFLSYGKGDRVSEGDWVGFLQKLDKVHATGVAIIILCHTKTANAPNPMGADYLRYATDLSEKKWSVTAKWADAVLFGTYFVDVKGGNKDKDGNVKGGKAIGGNERHLHTGESAVMPCKNRFGMETVIVMPSDPALTYETIMSQIVRKDAT